MPSPMSSSEHFSMSTPRRRRYASLTDAELAVEMRRQDARAFEEFLERFRPILEAFARATGIPTAEWPRTINDVLEDAALMILDGRLDVSAGFVTYLKAMARTTMLRQRRVAECEARYALLTSTDGGEYVVRSLCSEATLRASAGPDREVTPDRAAGALQELTALIMASMSPEEQMILGWVSASVPHRRIAEWIGASYAATTKRIWRLERRLRDTALSRLGELTPDGRREVERFLRREIDRPRAGGPS